MSNLRHDSGREWALTVIAIDARGVEWVMRLSRTSHLAQVMAAGMGADLPVQAAANDLMYCRLRYESPATSVGCSGTGGSSYGSVEELRTAVVEAGLPYEKFSSATFFDDSAETIVCVERHNLAVWDKGVSEDMDPIDGTWAESCICGVKRGMSGQAMRVQ